MKKIYKIENKTKNTKIITTILTKWKNIKKMNKKIVINTYFFYLKDKRITKNVIKIEKEKYENNEHNEIL